MFWVLKRALSDGSFEYPQHGFWMRNFKKIIFNYPKPPPEGDQAQVQEDKMLMLTLVN